MSGNEFGRPPVDGDENYDEVYETHRQALWDLLMTYADQHDLADGFLSDIVSDLGLSLRMVAYASETERPSMGGLRLDLDRFAREMGDQIREAKKDAGTFIAEAKAARDAEATEAAAAEAEVADAVDDAPPAEPESAPKEADTERSAQLTAARAFPRRQ